MYFALIINYIIKFYLKLIIFFFLETLYHRSALTAIILDFKSIPRNIELRRFPRIFLKFPEAVQDIELNLGDAGISFLRSDNLISIISAKCVHA